MNYYCNFCDKTIKRTSKYKQFESENQISSESSIICRYIFLEPHFDKFDEMKRKYVNIYKKT